MTQAVNRRLTPPQGSRPRVPAMVVTAALFVMLACSNLPTPLYAVYRSRFGFSAGALTLVFATYAIVLIPALVVFGQLSDRVGRRKVIAVGLVIAAVAVVAFAAARNIGWLYAARALQGLAVGVTTGTATAALVEIEPSGSHRTAAVYAVVGQAGGAAAGPLVAGGLAQWAPWPRVLCYLIGFAANVVVAVAVLRLGEPHRGSGRWRVQWPRLPIGHRMPFLRAGATAAACWAVGALYVSIVPTYVATVLRTHDLAVLGGVSGLMLATACAAQLVCARGSLTAGVAQPLGLLLLVVGVVALIVAFVVHGYVLVIGAAVFAGAGLGFGFFGAQVQVNELAPADRRGEVTAAFITCVYVGVAVAAISAGLLADVASLFTAVAVVGSVVAALAIATATWHVRNLGARQ